MHRRAVQQHDGRTRPDLDGPLRDGRSRGIDRRTHDAYRPAGHIFSGRSGADRGASVQVDRAFVDEQGHVAVDAVSCRQHMIPRKRASCPRPIDNSKVDTQRTGVERRGHADARTAIDGCDGCRFGNSQVADRHDSESRPGNHTVKSAGYRISDGEVVTESQSDGGHVQRHDVSPVSAADATRKPLQSAINGSGDGNILLLGALLGVLHVNGAVVDHAHE
mmetsp:Transcript_9881/g.30494  ORF Transcript_9881/g.30494 Transcript_9881/m.30494 type:complete len:220 (-) Transcript_9881:142-801(-)